MLHKSSVKMILNSEQNRQKKLTQKNEKLVFLKEYVEYADLHKSVLNKIMTMHE